MPLPDVPIGAELVDYRVEGVLGRGGMGVVYLAEDVRLHRKVALKLLDPQLASDQSFRARFLAESELAASLDHPRVIPIYEAGEADGLLFIAMRYVEGGDLKRLLRTAPLDARRTLALCAQVADALDFAHERGLVHRDVKPSNVLLDRRDHVYLADFGLTQRLGDARAAEPGLLGTLDYVAPEQIRGEEVDGRADVYALGCVLCECLSGQPPFARSDDAAVLYAHLEEQPESPSGLAQVMEKALAKRPEERYATCGELIEATRRALRIDEPPRPSSRRPPLRLVVAVLLVGAVLLAALLAVLEAPSPHSNSPLAAGGVVFRANVSAGRLVGQVAVGSDPIALVADSEDVWVADRASGTVSRIDPRKNTVAVRATAGSPAGVAIIPRGTVGFSPGSAVVVNAQDSSVTAVNALNGTVTKESLTGVGPFALPGFPFGLGSPRIAAGPSGIWMSRPDRVVGALRFSVGRLLRMQFIAPPFDERVDSYLSAIAVGDDGVWVVGDPLDPTLWRLDPTSGKVVAAIRLPDAPTDVAIGEGAVWVTSELDDRLQRIDPATNRVTARISAGRGADAVTIGGGSVWVADRLSRSILQINPRTMRVIHTTRLGATPTALAISHGELWVAAKPA